MRWSPRQLALIDDIQDPDLRVVIASGTPQSGKTRAAAFGFAWRAASHAAADFIVVGRSHRQMAATMLTYISEFAGAAGLGFRRRAEYLELGSTVPGGAPNRVWTIPATNEGAESRARSYAAAGLLLDEASVLPVKVVDSAFDRLSREGAFAVIATNPGSPLNWVRTRYFPHDDPLDGCAVHLFTSSDNPTLDPSYAADLEARYPRGSAMWRRMVLGEWASAEGAVYPDLQDALGDPPDERELIDWSVGIDYASSSATHAVLTALHPPTRVRWVVGEWRHHGLQDGVMPDHLQARTIHLWLGLRDIRRIAVDPSALGLISALRIEMPGVPVVAADNAVSPGIQFVRRELDAGLLRIAREDVPHLVREMSNYVYDERASMFGEDKPVKRDDHGPDALRYDRWTGAAADARPTVLRGSR